MRNFFQPQRTIWQVVLLGAIVICLWVYAPVTTWSETASAPPGKGQEDERIVRLDNGIVIELTETGVIQRSHVPYSGTDLWFIPAKDPQSPLVFENREGQQLLLYFTRIDDYYGEFRAVRVEDGKEQWVHPMWWRSYSIPESPIFVKPWIYFGRGTWLEKMDPDDGTTVERYPARVSISSLQALPDDAIEVYANVYTPEIPQISIRFQKGQFSPYVVAFGGRSIISDLDLFKRGQYVMLDFSSSYLALYQIEKKLPKTEFVAKWRDFDLQKAEKAYRRAYQKDLANPYFALYLAFAIYYQDREMEAKLYFQEAFVRSANFWEESLRLGSLCEGLGFIQWADAFYEQGTTLYFREVPAPPQDVTLLEVLVLLFGMRQSSALFAHGQIDRALHLLEVRRQIFPYTEGDNQFSRKYVRWLRRMGQEDKAVLEEQRIGRMKSFYDFEELTPGSFVGFMIAGLLLLLVIILKNEVNRWYELFIVLIAMFLIRGVTLLKINNNLKSITLILIILGYISIVALFRRRRILRQRQHQDSLPSRWRMMLGVTISSYIVILTGIFVAYILGQQIGHSPLVGKGAEILFIFGFIGLRRLVRRSSRLTPPLRNLKSFVLVWALLWCHIAWFHHYIIGNRIMESRPSISSVDRGNPIWIAHIDQKVEEARFQNRDLLFTQALGHQLGGDTEFARQIYDEISKDARVLNNLGVMLLEQDQNDARDYFERALKLDPDFAPALYNLGLIAGDQTLIECAQAGDAWRVKVYQKYAPDKPWIAIPTIREWDKALYWSQGGFFVKGFTETPFSFIEPIREYMQFMRELGYR